MTNVIFYSALIYSYSFFYCSGSLIKKRDQLPLPHWFIFSDVSRLLWTTFLNFDFAQFQ